MPFAHLATLAERLALPASGPPRPQRCEASAGNLPPAKSRPCSKSPSGIRDAASFAGQAAVKALVTELKHDTSFKRRAAAEALEDVDDPQATQPLLAALKDEDPTVQGFGDSCPEQRRQRKRSRLKLLERFRDPEPCVRLAAAEVLAKRIDPALAPEFLRLLADPNFEVRLSAVQFLGRIRDPEIAQALLPLLADSDSDVRQAVAQALGTIGEPAAIEALVLALTDEERAVRQAAELALGRIDAELGVFRGGAARHSAARSRR